MSEAEALEVFLNTPVTQDMIHHLVNITLHILPCESSKTITQQLPSPPNSPPVYKTKPLPSLMTFITKLVRYTNVYTGTLMSTIVYMNRLKHKLPKDAQGMACTRHRIFLACLIIASKNLNDSSPKNKHWSKYTDGLFRKEDVNLMERQLLMLLDWDLRIENDELVSSWKRFLDPIKSDLRRQYHIRNGLAQGTVCGSTQTVSQGYHQRKHSATYVPSAAAARYTPISASSSMSSISSAASDRSSEFDGGHSRASSVSSISSLPPTKQQQQQNYYKPSQTFANGYQSHNAGCGQTGITGYQLASYLENCNFHEQQELNNMMRQYCGY